MADPTRFVPIVVKLDSSQLKGFKKEVESTQAAINQSTSQTAKHWKQMTADEVRDWTASRKQIKQATGIATADEVAAWERANKKIVENEIKKNAEISALKRKSMVDANKGMDSLAKDFLKSTETAGAKGIKAAAKDAAELEQAATRAGKALASDLGVPMGTLTTSAGELAAALGPVGIGLAAIIAISIAELAIAAKLAEEIYGLTKKWSEYGAGLYKSHEATGIAVKDLALLKYNADVYGVSNEKVMRGVTMFSKQLYAAEGGSKQAIASLKAMGISQDDLNEANGRTLPLLYKLADKLHENEGGYRKTALASKELGRAGGPELAAFLGQGSAALKEQEAEMNRYGFAMDEEGAAKAKHFQEELVRLEKEIEGFGILIGGAASEDVLNFVEGLRQLGEYVRIAAGSESWEDLKRQIMNLTLVLAPAVFLALKLAGAIADLGKSQRVDTYETYDAGGLKSINLDGINRVAKKHATDLDKQILEETASKLVNAQNKRRAGAEGQDSIIEGLTNVIRSRTDIAPTGETTIPPAEAASKSKDDGYNKLLTSQRNLFFSNEDLKLAKAKATIETQMSLNKEMLAEHSISYKEYAKQEQILAFRLATAEKKRIDDDIEETKKHKSQIYEKEKETAYEFAARQNEDQKKMNELLAKREKIDQDFAKTQAELRKGQAEANKQWEDFTENQAIALAGLSGEDEKFAQARKKNQKAYQDGIDKWQAEANGRAKRMATDPNSVVVGGVTIDSLNEILARSNMLVDVEQLSAHVARAKLATTEREKVINQEVSVGILSQLQGRDAILALQREQKPLLENELAGLEKAAAAQGKFVAPETVARIKELHLELNAMGVDLQKMQEEGALKHMFDFDANHVNDSLRAFLASQANLQQTMEGLRTNAAKSVFSMFDEQIDKMNKGLGKAGSFLGEFEKQLIHMALAKVFAKAFGLDGSGTSGGGQSGGIPGAIMNMVGGGSGVASAAGAGSPFVGGSSRGSGGSVGNIINQAMGALPAGAKGGKAGGIMGMLSSGSGLLKGLFGGGAKAASGLGSGAASALTSGAKAASGLGSGAASALTSGAGAASSGAASAAGLGGMAAMFSNPFTAALAIAPIALPFIMKLFGGGVEKAIRSEVQKDYGVDIKDSKMLQQIKSIGDSTFGNQLNSHIPQLVAMDQVKQLVTSYATYADPNFFNTKLGQTAHLTDMSAGANQFIRRANGGPVWSGVPTLVGERRAEFIQPNIGGMVHKDANQALDSLSDRLASRMEKRGGGQSNAGMNHVVAGLSSTIMALSEQVQRLTAMSPGSVLGMGAQQNPQAISGGLLEGLRGNFGHRRELNGLTGA